MINMYVLRRTFKPITLILLKILVTTDFVQLLPFTASYNDQKLVKDKDKISDII